MDFISIISKDIFLKYIKLCFYFLKSNTYFSKFSLMLFKLSLFISFCIDLSISNFLVKICQININCLCVYTHTHITKYINRF